MKKLVIILGLILLALTTCAQNEWKYPLYVGTNGGTGGAVTLYGATSGSLTLRVPAIAGTTIFEFPSTLGTNGYVLSTNGAGVLSWVAGGAGSMVYPAAGIGLSDGTQWLGSIANNSANWNTAYSWGNHALVGYVTGTPWTTMGYVTGTPWTAMGYLTSETSHADVIVDGDFVNPGIMVRGASSGVYSILTNNSTNWNTAYTWGNHASAGYAPLNSPIFTGTVGGITATMVGLGNVTNESKATMFTNATFTGTTTLPSTTSIGNVSSTEIGYIDGLTGIAASRQNINDSILQRIATATIGVAAADSNAYGGYTTRTYVESLLGSGTGMTTQRLPFIIGTTAGAPANADTIVTHTAFSGKHIDLYRDGVKQYQNFTATNTIDGFRVSGSDVVVNPAWSTGEQVIIDITEPVLWSSLAFEGEESTLLTGLSGYWKLDETSGTTANDATGTQNGTTTATVNVTGKLGRAYEFDAAEDIITIPYNTNISPKGTAFSLAVWFKIDSLPTVTGRGNYLFQQGNNATPYLSHSLEVDNSDNKITARSRNAAGTLYEVRSTAAISVDTWYQLVFVNSGDGTALKIYLNGSDVTASTVTFTGTVFEGLSVSCFGNAYPGAPSSYLDGMLDSFAIWSRALTSGEVTTLYNSGNGRTHPFN